MVHGSDSKRFVPLFALVGVFCAWCFAAVSAPAVASAQGWGLDATGGAGHPIVEVGNVAELRAALGNPVNKTVVVSAVLENWVFTSRLAVQSARNLTLDCGGFKNFIGAAMLWADADNVIIRGCRTRNESGNNGDCIALNGATNVRLESFDGTYSTDECIDINGDTSDVAIVDSRIGAVLWNSDHPSSPGHSYAIRVGAIRNDPAATVERVLIDGLQILASSHRVPQVVSHDSTTQVCMRDSTIWHFGERTDHGALFDGLGVETVLLDNEWIPGPESLATAVAPIVFTERAGPATVYAEGNLIDGVLVPQSTLVRSGGTLAASVPFSCPDWVSPTPSNGNGGSAIQIPPDPTARSLVQDFLGRVGSIGAKERDQTTPVPPPDILPGTSVPGLGDNPGLLLFTTALILVAGVIWARRVASTQP